jgi:hypothetical protein
METMTNEPKIDLEEHFLESNDTANKTGDGICVDKDSWTSDGQSETITFDPSVFMGGKNPSISGKV